MQLNVVTIGVDTPVALRFNLRGEFESEQLNGFDYLQLTVGDENYTTFANPEKLFIDPKNNKRLILKIGASTKLSEGDYFVTIKGFNAAYPNGFELNSRVRPLLRPLEVRRI